MRQVQPHDQGSTAPTGQPLADLSADDAVTALHATHYAALVRIATLLLRDRGAAEEVVQDAFVALHRRWARLDDRANALAYLRTSVVNGARSVQRHREVVSRHAPVVQAPPPDAPGADERLLAGVRREQVLAALDRLSRRQREVVVLRIYLDQTEEQVAATLGISRGAVKSHGARATAALRILLRPVLQEES